MRILILEDDENRIKKFKQNFIGCERYITHLTATAIKWLEEVEFDIIFLDCDLLPEHYLTWQNPDRSTEDTGQVVADWLGNNPEVNKVAQIIIHSHNDFHREKMRQACIKRNAQIVPFSTLFERLIITR